MPAIPAVSRMSLRDYVNWEERQEEKHEYHQGTLRARAGATIRHNILSGNMLARLHQLLEGHDCEVFGSGLRIRINEADLSTYPDVSVVCGEPKTDRVDRHAVTNPRLIVEVLSKSTENYDRGKKFEFYQRLESFREYVVVYQNESRIIHYVRQPDQTWKYRLIVGVGETLQLETVPCELSLEAIYRDVKLGPESDEDP